MSQFSDETNLRLFHTQNLLGIREQMSKLESSEAKLKSVDFAAWLGLRAVWEAWLNELVSEGHLDSGTVADFAHLAKGRSGQAAPVQHLINLKSAPDSWLSILLHHIDCMAGSVAKNTVNSSAVSSSTVRNKASDTATVISPVPSSRVSLPELSLKDVSEPEELEILYSVWTGFKEYIQFTREQQQEW